jgi:hypothetical protein
MIEYAPINKPNGASQQRPGFSEIANNRHYILALPHKVLNDCAAEKACCSYNVNSHGQPSWCDAT